MPVENDNEYEIMPINEIEDMKKEIKELKKGSVDMEGSKAIEKLNQNIGDLLLIFKEATKEIREEEKKAEETHKKITEIAQSITELFDQNAKIAEAMISIHDSVESMKLMMGEKNETPGLPVQPAVPLMPGPALPSGPIPPPGPMMPPSGQLTSGQVPPGKAESGPQVAPPGFTEHHIGPVPMMPPSRQGLRAPVPPVPQKKKRFFI